MSEVIKQVYNKGCVGISASVLYEKDCLKSSKLLSKVFKMNIFKQREILLTSKEIAVQFVPESSQDALRWNYSYELLRHSDYFEGWDVDVIHECLCNETPYAQEWIADNVERVNKLHKGANYEQEPS